MSEVFLVVGLGNPGRPYAGNRHNAGYLVADRLAERIGGRFRTQKAHRSPGRAEVLDGRLGGVRAVLIKPQAAMNESGGPVAGVRTFFSVPLEQVVVVHDELDLPYGSIRVKQGGGSNGHNGLRSLTRSLGGPDYTRVRFGIGRPPGRQDPADYVLRDFSGTERRDLDLHVEQAADAVEAVLLHGADNAQKSINP
jgi:peptidyl-tRNA hydrolase, PTH1 family